MEMKTKTCGECKYYVPYSICPCVCVNNITDYCGRFEPKVITNGDKIRQGGDVALINFYAMERCKICAFNGTDRCNQTECAYGLAEWLKQEAKDEQENK